MPQLPERDVLNLLYALTCASERMKQIHRILEIGKCEGLIKHPTAVQELKKYAETMDRVVDETKRVLEIGETG